MQIYPVIELPQQPIKIKHAPQDDQYLPYLMIGAVALSSMNFIWITLLAIVNWYAYIHLFTHPYVGTVLFFGLMTFIMLVSVCLLVLSLCMQCNGVIKYTMVDDLIIALYTVLGLPMGRIADRHSRRNLMAGGIAAWSVMCSLCGSARTYGQLFAARCGVGVGWLRDAKTDRRIQLGRNDGS